MKKTLLLALLFVLCISGHAQTENARAVAGQYTGELYVSLMEEVYNDDTRLDDPTTVSITVGQDGAIDFALNNFSFSGALLGDISLPGITVSRDGRRYTFGENAPRRFSFLEGEIVADASLDNTQSYAEGDSLVAYIPVVWLMDEETQIPIYVLFKGVRPTPEGISNLTATRREQTVYDLGGRRQSAEMGRNTKGVRIISGKKQLIK